MECVSACWDPCTERETNALDRVQKKAAQFTNHTKDSDWETLAQRRTIASPLLVTGLQNYMRRVAKATLFEHG